MNPDGQAPTEHTRKSLTMKTSRIIAASALAFAIVAGAVPAVAADLTPPANDDIAHAAVLPSENNSIKGTNVGATTEPGEPSHGDQLHPSDNSVWYRWTAPRSGRVIFRTLGSNFDTTLAAYTSGGDPVSTANLAQRAANDDVVLDNTNPTSQVRVKVNQGDVLFLAVDGFGSATGDITLTWTTNDDFVAAQPLPGPTAGSFSTAAVHNEGATPELGEPRHSGKPAVTSVWYSWKAPFSGIANFQATKSTYDSILAVYTGDRVDALTTVAFNDNVAGSDIQTRMLFSAVAGTTYKIALTGTDSETGFQVINYQLTKREIIAGSASTPEGKAGSTKILNLPVTLSTPNPTKVTVQFATADRTAKAGSDYTATSGTLTFEEGQTSKFVPVTITGDATKEHPETFSLILAAPSGGFKVRPGGGIGTITNDD